jgi:signal transduction histidine kinase
MEIVYETKRLQQLAEINQLRADAADRELVEYKRTEADRIERERLEFIVEQEGQLARQKERVLSRIHHEFRTPVTIIGTAVELLTRYLNRLSPEAVEEHRQTIGKQFKLIDRHLNDIGKVLRVHDQPLVEIQEPIDWTDLCLSAVRQAEEQVGKEGRIQFGLGQMPSNPYVDPILLKEIMLQLLTNALKFSEGSVHFQLHETKDQLEIVVKDQGIGIPSDEIKSIFKPLYRATNLDEISGTGLGLTIVSAYVELLRGTISIESELGSGSCFRVNIPLKE